MGDVLIGQCVHITGIPVLQLKEEEARTRDEEEVFFGPNKSRMPSGMESIRDWPWKQPQVVRQRMKLWAHGEPPVGGWPFRLVRAERSFKYGENGEDGLPRKVVYENQDGEICQLQDYYQIARFLNFNVFIGLK